MDIDLEVKILMMEAVGEEGEFQDDAQAAQLLQEEDEEVEEIPEALIRHQEVLEKKWKEFIKDRRSMPVRNLTFGVPIRSREAGEVLSGCKALCKDESPSVTHHQGPHGPC